MMAKIEPRRLAASAGHGQAFKPSLGRIPMSVFVVSVIVVLDPPSYRLHPARVEMRETKGS